MIKALGTEAKPSRQRMRTRWSSTPAGARTSCGSSLTTLADTRCSVPQSRSRSAQRIEHGDAEAKNQMIAGNLRLVVHWARRYQGRGVDLTDLVQEGTFGLMRAVEKFDWKRGFKFSTYATWWIRQSLQRAVQSKGRAIRLPEDAVAAENAAERAGEGHERHLPRVVASLDQPVATDANATLGDLSPPTTPRSPTTSSSPSPARASRRPSTAFPSSSGRSSGSASAWAVSPPPRSSRRPGRSASASAGSAASRPRRYGRSPPSPRSAPSTPPPERFAQDRRPSTATRSVRQRDLPLAASRPSPGGRGAASRRAGTAARDPDRCRAPPGPSAPP